MPDLLDPLFQPVASLRGVGDATAERIARAVGGARVLDLLFHLPEAYVDRRARPTVAAAEPGTVATMDVEVVAIQWPDRGTNHPWRVTVTDGTGFAEVAFWGHPPPAAVRPRARLMLSGKVEVFGDRKQIKAPRIVAPDRPDGLPGLEPIWPLTAKLTQPQMERAMAAALGLLPALPEWHDAALMRREGWPGFVDALRAVQAPTDPQGTRRATAWPMTNCWRTRLP